MVCPDASRAEAVGSVFPPWTLVGARWASSHSGRSFLMATETFKPCWSSDCCCVYSAVHKGQHPWVQTSSRKCSGQLCLFLGICFYHFAVSAEQCFKKLDAQEQPQLCTKSLDFESLFTHFVYFEIVRSEWDETWHPVDWAKMLHAPHVPTLLYPINMLWVCPCGHIWKAHSSLTKVTSERRNKCL